jgi:cobalt-zinc-cadmium efflux system outer membrane protein
MMRADPQHTPRRLFSAVLLALAVAGAGGCAVNPREGFAPVEQTVRERTGVQVHWDTGGPEDAQVRATVDRLLAGELTPDQAVQVALVNSPDLQAVYEGLGVSQADLVQAGLLPNPVVSANLRFPGRPHYPFELSVEQDFIQLLFLPLKKAVAEATFEGARAQVIDAVLRRAAGARAAYYRYQGALQLSDMRRSVLAAAQANADASRRLREAGNIRELDYAGDQGLLAQARVDLAGAEAEAAEAREDLAALMGAWGTSAAGWRVPGRLPDPPAGQQSWADLESTAVAQRQDLAAARNSLVSAARLAGFANYAALLSGSTVGLDVARDADVATTLGPAISASIPIFDQGQAAVARAQAQFRQARARYQALAIQIRSQLRKAQYRAAAAQQRALYYRDSVLPLRHRIVEETQLQYNGMFVGVSVLLQARQAEIDAGARYVEAVRDYWVAQAELEQALGGRPPAPVTGAPDAAPDEAHGAAAPAAPPSHDHEHTH